MTMNEWVSVHIGDALSAQELRTALDRPLKTKEGKMVFYIALWYQHGNPLMGRMWEERGRLSATFTDGTKVFTGKSIIGEVQVLSKNSPLVTGLDYAWKPFKQVVPTVSGQRWAPMQVQYIVPCVIVLDDGGTEILGSINMKTEIACAVTYDCRVVSLCGQDVQNLLILCTQPNEETIAI